MLPKYDKGMLQVMASVRRYLSLDSSYASDPKVEEWLQKNAFDQIVVMLIDGMGSKIIEPRLDSNAFLKTHLLENTQTVFPPTTTAATTSLLNGKSPKENAWLGWNQYFKEYDDNIVLFREMSQYGDKAYPGFTKTSLPVDNMVDELNQKNIPSTTIMSTFGQNACKDFDSFLALLQSFSHSNEYKFVYAYWDELDSLMHKVGPSDPSVKELLQSINDKLDAFTKELSPKTGILILADHGQIDVENYHVDKDPELNRFLKHPLAIEPRCTAFYIKDGMGEEFVKVFNQKLGHAFTLLTHQEVVDMNLFGLNEAHPRFEEFIGDYVALATSNICLAYKQGFKMMGQHAGTLEAEMMIPVIVYPR